MDKQQQVAAVYARSSKDRGAGVSTQAQSEAAEKIASDRTMSIVEYYVDNEESASTENRPEFQRLLMDIVDAKRGWNTLIVYEPTRIARVDYISINFDILLQQNNVKILYVLIPDSEPLAEMMLIDMHKMYGKLHKEMSKIRAMSAQRRNLKQGFWAGGSYPFGYKPKKLDTGIIRDGEHVYKTKLVLDEEIAPKLRKYFELRADGISRKIASEMSGIEYKKTTLHYVDKQADTLYCGHLNWCKANGKVGGKRTKGIKESRFWEVYPNTCERLITDEIGKKIVEQLSSHSYKSLSNSKGLLSGLLETPWGERYCLNTDNRRKNRHKSYRVKLEQHHQYKYKYVRCDLIDKKVSNAILADIMSEEFIELLTTGVEGNQHNKQESIANLKKSIANLKNKMSNTIDFITETRDSTFRKEIGEKLGKLKQELSQKQQELSLLKEEKETQKYSNAQIKTLLNQVFVELDASQGKDETFKVILKRIIERIVLDPFTLECEIVYTLPIADTCTGFNNSLKMVLPRGLEPLFTP